MPRKIKSNKRRRICRFTGCKHLLSVYNLETYCHVHQQHVLSRNVPAPALSQR